ncbi:histidine--tRNA ligase [Prosthecomicrobium pneumaticum]|uniref:Histidine--tRNA ligase n=1 Tax=Prosthecomicrobium pneumaticum TaxID=81895 RepID=A0A7W9CUW5_9HYPH|nr:histidine--tRNA ligase [Prosthecomicrobium pneumaticum]MBB5752134.1 histidyl-tRNA synthetase [Prosthecomicrobium pneumaticum]
MAEKSKTSAVKARLPRGLVDRPAGEIKAAERMLGVIRGVYERYGFDPVETPLIEYTDALGKFLPDQDRPNEGVFSFQDDDEQWLSLRYDLTAPLARYVAEHFDALPKPYRSYRAGWVFRNEKPGPGRFRQFMQFDADTVGAASPAADAEMCMMMADTLEALGLERGQYVIRVNNRKVLDGVMEAIGLSGEENAGRRLTVLRAIDKLDKFGPGGVAALLGAGRLDESGDFTKGAGLDPDGIDRVLNFTGWGEQGSGSGSIAGVSAVTLSNFAAAVGTSVGGAQGVAELTEIEALVAAAGYSDRVRIDPSVVRGLEYYTGPVFEAELLFETVNEKGEPARFGSVGGGGRYDGLVGRFRADPVPATGFSIGVSRLMAALANLGKLSTEDEVGPVVVTVFDRDRIADYQTMVQRLRAGGIRAELYLGGSGPKAQLKYADRRNSPCVIIQGSDERDRGVVQIKDLALGKALAATIEDNATWREARPAQFEVPVDGLVEAVRSLLGGRP